MGKKGRGEVSQSKRQWFERAISQGVSVHLDPRTKGVVLPPWLWFKDNAPCQAILDFVPDFRGRIRDLEVTSESVSASLWFETELFRCTIPWSSVYAMFSGKNSTTWQDGFPPELSLRSTAPTADVRPISRAPKRTEKQAKRPRLTLIRGGLS